MTDLVSQLVAQLEDMRGKVIELCQTYGNALPHWSLERTDAALTAAKAGGWVAAPVEPTEAQWGGLARDIMLAFDMNAKSPALLLATLRNLGHDIPQWLLDEIKDAGSTHVLSKGTRAVLIYRAMLAARPLPTPPKEQA